MALPSKSYVKSPSFAKYFQGKEMKLQQVFVLNWRSFYLKNFIIKKQGPQGIKPLLISFHRNNWLWVSVALIIQQQNLTNVIPPLAYRSHSKVGQRLGTVLVIVKTLHLNFKVPTCFFNPWNSHYNIGIIF
jgi:hypothetical protein